MFHILTFFLGVATIAQIMPDRSVKIHFDEWSDSFDYEATLDNDDLHPVGYCQSIGHKLQSPRGYNGPFCWPKYLKEIGQAPVFYYTMQVFFHCLPETM
jgi:hypothetical protein